MFTPRRCIFAGSVLLVCGWANAELQNVDVGGKIEIYGGWYSDFYEPGGPEMRIVPFLLPSRSLGPNGTLSAIRAGDGGNSLSTVQQRTRLYTSADFTNDVSAFVELDSIHVWGDDFRSDYITGTDLVAETGDDVELYQGYLEACDLLGYPVRLRIGRQEMEFGSGWLVGADPGPDPFVGLSFDAVRLTIAGDAFCVDAWWSKLADRSPIEEDGDVDFYGVYAHLHEAEGRGTTEPLRPHECLFPMHLVYHGLARTGPFRGRTAASSSEAEFDIYWMLVRDATRLSDTQFVALVEALENVFDRDDYDVTYLHTMGTRGAGTYGALDWEIEAAYQWGEADAVGALFRLDGGLYGDSQSEWDAWAGHTEVGYTLGGKYTPRLFAGGAYYGGEDNRDLSFREWLFGAGRPKASLSFNRLFSSWREDDFIDPSAMSNFWKAYFGASASVTEAVEINASLAYFHVVENFNNPVTFNLGDWRIPIAPSAAFWTTDNAKDLGWQLSLWAAYKYSEDLTFEVGCSHYWVGEAIADGVAFADENGLANVGGRGRDDASLVYFLTTLEF